MTDRAYQIVVLGGTGFVGKLVAEHIARDYPVSSVRIAERDVRSSLGHSRSSIGPHASTHVDWLRTLV